MGIDTAALLFATVLTILTGVGFGIAPALQVAGSSLIDETKENRFPRHRGCSLLVISEIALSVFLLAGAGLMIRGFIKLQKLDLVF